MHNREAESAMPSGRGPGGAGSRQASLERVKRAREHLAWIQLQRPRDYESMDRAVRRLQDEIADLEYKKRQAHDHEGVYVYDERNKKGRESEEFNDKEDLKYREHEEKLSRMFAGY